ncbi:MAG TPA: transglutaminase family protein [Pyrinomonadaceae bacterium]|jgi:transglutaminase-like putative cysteine protease|nr:transglutaminase family protein [Pyrinomonadaceae bacterium]
MLCSIDHVTKFRYSAPITESVMELRMRPRNDERQRCLSFDLGLRPQARASNYQDYLGNVVHHFDIPGQHTQLVITARALVETFPHDEPPASLDSSAWDALDRLVADGDYWDMLMPSRYARPTELLHELARELRAERRDDPLTVLREINTAIYDAFAYEPQSTRVDSPIDDALGTRKGVCQDYSHIFITLARQIRVPCRYVSGYLFHRVEYNDRSAQDATHAWVEALLPELGWVGFDSTNNLLAGERHIRVAVGRDYSDVPPTRGVFKGTADSEISVAVQVKPSEEPLSEETLRAIAAINAPSPDAEQAQQQQQQ